MDETEKRRAYFRIASDLIDYIDACAERRIVPLKHDANVFRCRLNRAAYTDERSRK